MQDQNFNKSSFYSSSYWDTLAYKAPDLPQRSSQTDIQNEREQKT